MVINWLELKDLRALKGWTQAEFAEAIGVHPKTIVNWESNGVPPRSEYKVTRALGDELSYLNAKKSGHLSSDYTLDEWKEYLRQSDEIAQQSYEAVGAEDQAAYEQYEDSRIQARIQEQQAAYDTTAAKIELLSSFSSIDLLHEVIRRERLVQHALEARDVGGAADTTDLHSIDLSQGDVDLAASKDNSSVTEQTHPDYENDSQDSPED